VFHDIKRLRRETGRQASLFFDVGANVGQTKPRPHGVICSMSRSGNVWDNAAMESFFSSLKTERTGRKTYRTRDEARADVFDYIERFYNHKRRHSKIGFMSPMEFERQAGLA
jgi:putative transposase